MTKARAAEEQAAERARSVALELQVFKEAKEGEGEAKAGLSPLEAKWQDALVTPRRGRRTLHEPALSLPGSCLDTASSLG